VLSWIQNMARELKYPPVEFLTSVKVSSANWLVNDFDQNTDHASDLLEQDIE
jgi:hypothetical protein